MVLFLETNYGAYRFNGLWQLCCNTPAWEPTENNFRSSGQEETKMW